MSTTALLEQEGVSSFFDLGEEALIDFFDLDEEELIPGTLISLPKNGIKKFLIDNNYVVSTKEPKSFKKGIIIAVNICNADMILFLNSDEALKSIKKNFVTSSIEWYLLSI